MTPDDHPHTPPGPRVPRVVERGLEDLQDVGLSPSLVERFVSWWQRYGLRKAVIFALAVTVPLWRYVWVPNSVSAGLSTIAEAYGAELSVEDWTSDWTNIAVTGEHVTLHARGPYTEERLLRADSVELDWSLLRGLGNAWQRVRSMFGDAPPEEPVHAIRLHQATLHVERLLSGRWNWRDAIDADRIEPSAIAKMRLPAVDADELRLVWVEHLPGESGGGLIERKTASLFLDDVRLRFADLMLPLDDRPDATRFTVEGRTGDGRFEANGSMNLARWAAPLPVPAAPGARNAAVTAAGGELWAPTFNVAVYLENVGAAALSRVVSDASLMPTSGTMTGHVKLAVAPSGQMTCDIDLQLLNVRYGINPRSSYVQARHAAVEAGVRDMVVNDHVAAKCQAKWDEPELRVAKAVQAEITGGAVRHASPAVQAAAGYDRLRFVALDDAAIKSFTSDMSASIGRVIGGERGAAVAKALADTDTGRPGNPVTRGLSSVGRGIKRIFGGGGDNDDQKKKKR